MKPRIFERGVNIHKHGVVQNNIPKFSTNDGTIIEDSGIQTSTLEKTAQHINNLVDHYKDGEIHITQDERERWNKRESITEHAARTDIHVSKEEKEFWNEKESVAGAQAKANEVMSYLNEHTADNSLHLTYYDKQKLANSYSREEIDSLISSFQSGNDWKESVNTYSDLFTTYPKPEDGWTVNILDSDLTYRYNGDEWVCISANFIPNSSELSDGKMTKAQYLKLAGIEEHANNYIHPNNQYCRHVTDDQIAYWSRKADGVLASLETNGLMSSEMFEKLFNIADRANYYVHPEKHSANMIETTENLQFVSETEKIFWNQKAENRDVTSLASGLMTAAEHVKLLGIEENANRYVHPDKHTPSEIETDANNMFVTHTEKLAWNSKYDKSNFITGTCILNGTAGSRVIHDLNDATKSYTFLFTVISNNDPEHLGNIYITKRSSDVMVYSSGGNILDTIEYVIIVHPQ